MFLLKELKYYLIIKRQKVFYVKILQRVLILGLILSFMLFNFDENLVIFTTYY